MCWSKLVFIHPMFPTVYNRTVQAQQENGNLADGQLTCNITHNRKMTTKQSKYYQKCKFYVGKRVFDWMSTINNRMTRCVCAEILGYWVAKVCELCQTHCCRDLLQWTNTLGVCFLWSVVIMMYITPRMHSTRTRGTVTKMRVMMCSSVSFTLRITSTSFFSSSLLSFLSSVSSSSPFLLSSGSWLLLVVSGDRRSGFTFVSTSKCTRQPMKSFKIDLGYPASTFIRLLSNLQYFVSL